MDQSTYDLLNVILWRLFVLGVPFLPAIWIVLKARKEIESKLAWFGIGVATYGIAAFIWIGAIAWMFSDWWTSS
ncbi:MAG: hypothetical protein OEZ51_12465 [Nitrospinota bacterium]|nr:hypothetical protein [Nitrospinota bacterium]